MTSFDFQEWGDHSFAHIVRVVWEAPAYYLRRELLQWIVISKSFSKTSALCELCKGDESQPQIATWSASPLPVDSSYSRKDLEAEDGADENNPVALKCALSKPEDAETPPM